MNERRQLLRGAGLATLGLSGLVPMLARGESDSGYVAPVPADTGASGHVVVVGGGMAGATAAKYLRLWGGAKLRVTLIERDPVYVSNIMSNLVLNGTRTLDGLNFGYAALRDRYGVQLVRGEVEGVDPVARTLSYRAPGAPAATTLSWDRLVVAPGIEFDVLPGLSAGDYDTRFPHAWKAGPQTALLRRQLLAMPAGGAFVMTIPEAPYRCPPGPYERACLVADWLKRNKRGSTVVVLDANPDITAEKHSFETGFFDIHRGVVRYERGVKLTSIEPATAGTGATVRTAAHGDFAAAVLNPIPPQRAPRWMTAVGLIGPADRWALVDPRTYERTGLAGVHVIGDAANHGLPKAGHVANVEAKVCADAITRVLRGQAPDPEPMANSACYSPITATTASWLTAVYRYDGQAVPPKMVMVKPPAAEAVRITTDSFSEMNRWFTQLMNDSFA